jgi:aminoglycoside phosphotransferase (APT) family kinase protein
MKHPKFVVRNSNAILLRVVTDALDAVILPAVGTESGRTAGKLALTLLRLLLSRETRLIHLVDAEIESLESLCAGMSALIATGTAPPGTPTESLSGALGDERYGQRHRRLLEAQAELMATAETLVAHRTSMSTQARDAAGDELLAEMATRDLAFTRAVLSCGRPEPTASEATCPPGLTREQLERYLVARFPERRNLIVTDVAGAGFSMSKQILFFSIRDASGGKEDLVLRQEKAIRWMEADCTLVKNEYALIKCAHEIGLPVPEPLWLDTGSALGPDFMVMRKVAGEQLGEPFKAHRPLSEEMIMQMAEILARLHGAGLEPFESFFRSTGQAAVLDMTLREATLHRIEVWRAYFADANQFPNPGKPWLFDWLARNVPDYSESSVMVHGDFNLHNLLAENGSITTCLDWEWGHAGSALEDLNNIRPHVEKHSSWTRFCQHYLTHGGQRLEFDDTVLNYNRCLTNTIYSAAASKLAWYNAHGKVNDLAAVFGSDYYGLEFHRVALESALKKH